MTPTTTQTPTQTTTTSSAWDRALEFVRPGRRRRILGEPHVALLALSLAPSTPPGPAVGGRVAGSTWRS